MLKKIITGFTKSLPESSRKRNDDEDELNVSEDEDSSAYGEDEEEGEEEGTDKKKGQTSMIIRVMIILGIGYVAVDHFFISAAPKQSVEEMIAANAPKRKKGPRPDDTQSRPSTPAVAVNPEKAQPTEAPIENVSIMGKDENMVAAEPSVSSNPIESSKETAKDKFVEEAKVDNKGSEEIIDNKINQLIDNVEKDNTPVSAETNPVPNDSDKPTAKASMEDMIVDNNVLTLPPQYDQLGRGLVYNCKDKYWACVNKPSYVTCNKNMKWNKSKGNAQECVTQNIYSSDEDCAKVQKFNVNTNLATEFCK